MVISIKTIEIIIIKIIEIIINNEEIQELTDNNPNLIMKNFHMNNFLMKEIRSKKIILIILNTEIIDRIKEETTIKEKEV